MTNTTKINDLFNSLSNAYVTLNKQPAFIKSIHTVSYDDIFNNHKIMVHFEVLTDSPRQPHGIYAAVFNQHLGGYARKPLSDDTLDQFFRTMLKAMTEAYRCDSTDNNITQRLRRINAEMEDSSI